MSDSTHYRDSHLFDSVADSKDIVHHEERLEQIRSAVEISREAVKAVSKSGGRSKETSRRKISLKAICQWIKEKEITSQIQNSP